MPGGDSTDMCPQPQQEAPWGWRRGDRGTKTVLQQTQPFHFPQFKGGNIENPQNPNKPTLILLSRHTAVGGLLQHRWDGADLPPTPVNSSATRWSYKTACEEGFSPVTHRAWGWLATARLGESRFWGPPASVQAGMGWQLHPRGRL